MHMPGDERIVFGEKHKFSIELKQYHIPKKFYLRLWLNNKAIGDFKRGGSLDYMINTYFRLLENIDNLYEEKFENMTHPQIFNDILYDITIERTPELESELYERQQKFGYEFGDKQFNDFTFLILYPKHKKTITILVYEMDGRNEPHLHSFSIEDGYFFSTFKEFVNYAFENDLKKNKPFFPKGFHKEDFQ